MCLRLALLISLFSFSFAHAAGLDDLNPKSPDIDRVLMQMDQDYESATGMSPFLVDEEWSATSCFRASCPTWARVNLKEQLFYLYVDGLLTYAWTTSTGRAGFETPLIDRHPTSRIYDAYSSKLYPGGNFEGLGNMPYAVFVSGGYAIHGTPEVNWPLLGTAVSGGCIRLLPENGKIFNRLVRANGRSRVWMTVESGE